MGRRKEGIEFEFGTLSLVGVCVCYWLRLLLGELGKVRELLILRLNVMTS